MIRSSLRSVTAALVLSLLIPAAAHATGTNMPWEAPLQQILDSVQGPVAKIIAVLIIIGTGLALAFGENSGGMRRLIQIVFGLSIAFAAASFFLTFFNFAGGALVAGLPGPGALPRPEGLPGLGALPGPGTLS